MRIARPIENALRLSVIEGSFFGVYWNIILVIVINGLAIALNATELQLAVLNSLPLLSNMFGLPAARIIQSRDIRKPFVIVVELISRTAWLGILFILLLPDNPTLRVWFIIFVTALSHLAHAGGVVGWLSWISDVIPEQIRGIYFGVRTAVTGIIGLIGLTIASSWADKIKEQTDSGPGYFNTLYILLVVGFIFAMFSLVILYLQPVRRMKNMVTSGWKAIWETLTSPNGKKIAVTWIAIWISTGVTTGIYMQFFLNKLELSWMGITAYIWIVHTTSTLISPVMGRLSDRFGYRNVLMVSWLGVFWQPLLSVFTPNDMHHIFGLMPFTIFIDAIACGVFWPAVNITLNNIVIAETTSEKRAGFFGALTAMGGISGFTAATLAGILATEIGTNTFTVAGIPLDNLRTPLLIGSILRFFAGLLILTIKEPPRKKGQITSSEAFNTVWRVLTGKPTGRVRL